MFKGHTASEASWTPADRILESVSASPSAAVPHRVAPDRAGHVADPWPACSRETRPERASAPKPKARSARPSRSAFAADGSTKRSRSPVARGRPCTARACAPTITKRTRSEHNKPMSSLHSGGSFTVHPPRELADQFHGRDSLRQGPASPPSHLTGGGGLGRRPTIVAPHRCERSLAHRPSMCERGARRREARLRCAAAIFRRHVWSERLPSWRCPSCWASPIRIPSGPRM